MAGTLQLLLDDDGLTRLTADQFHVSPAVTTLDPAGQDILMRGFSPTGDLDAVVDLKTGLVSGTLFNAYIDAAHVPFPLGPATIPFQVDENNVLRIDEAKLAFNGGDVVLSLEAGEHEAFMSIDVDGAEFKEEILHLIPGYQEWEEVDVADGGSFECHLKVSLTDNMSEVSVVGGGGFYVSAVDFTKHGVQLEDVVGRFEVNEQNVLKFPEISARTLGGRFRTSGTLGLLDEEFRIELSLEDLDVAQLHDVFLTTEEHEDDVAGWLQGSIQGSGQLQDPASYVAKGQASVRAGNFWDTPTFEQILKVLTMSRQPGWAPTRGRRVHRGREARQLRFAGNPVGCAHPVRLGLYPIQRPNSIRAPPSTGAIGGGWKAPRYTQGGVAGQAHGSGDTWRSASFSNTAQYCCSALSELLELSLRGFVRAPIPGGVPCG